MTFGLIVIGDEILSGKRQDKHFAKVVALLAERGLSLSWVHYAGDDRAALVDLLRRTFAGPDIVFSCGGIGATPDDHTRQAAAAALGVPLARHPEAAALIAQRVAESAAQGQGSADMAAPDNQQRLKMGDFPSGAEIIPNPYNRIPGFRVRHHWFVPGFPVMAWPMLEAVLDTHYRHLFHRQSVGDRSMIVHDLAESTITPLMEAVERDFPLLRVYSLPSVGEAGGRRHIELGVKGDRVSIPAAYAKLLDAVRRLGGEISRESEPGADGAGPSKSRPAS